MPQYQRSAVVVACRRHVCVFSQSSGFIVRKNEMMPKVLRSVVGDYNGQETVSGE